MITDAMVEAAITSWNTHDARIAQATAYEDDTWHWWCDCGGLGGGFADSDDAWEAGQAHEFRAMLEAALTASAGAS